MDPILGVGTQIKVDRGAGYVAVVKLTEIGAIGLEGADVEVTNHDSAGGVREYIRGLTEPSEVTFTGIWTGDATQTALMADVLLGMAQPNLPYQAILPQGRGQWDFNGYLRSFTVNPQLDGRIECTGAVKMSGIPTFAITAGENLTALTISTGTLTPAFAGTTYTYVDPVVVGTASVTVTPTCAAADSITVNGVVVASGVPSGAITLGAAPSLTQILIVTHKADKTDKTYEITVARAGA